MDLKLRPLWPGILLAAVISFGTMLGLLTVPIFLIAVYQWVIPARSSITLLWLLLAVVMGLVAFAALDHLRARIMHRLGAWVAASLGVAALETSVTNVLYGGKVSAQVLRDVSEVRSFVAQGGLTDAIELTWVPFLIILLLLLHPAYALIAGLGVAATVILAFINDRVVRRPMLRAEEMAVDSLNQTNSFLRNAEVVHALGLGQQVALRWARANDAIRAIAERPALWDRVIGALTRFIRMALAVALIGVGAMLLLSGATDAGRLFGAILIIRHSLRPVGNIVQGWQQWVLAYAAFERIKAAVAETQSRRSNKPLSRPQGSLEVDRLVFVPPGTDRAVLRGISFTVDPGEVLGVIGPSAAGKSTLARMLVGLWRPSSGGIYLDGQSVYLWERTSFGAHVGYLPQNPGLFEGTVRENIARLGEAEDADVLAAAKLAGAHEMICALNFGYSTEVGHSSFLLSGGQRQRLALARAMFGNPHLIVLDEPDASLDEAGRAALTRAILEAKSRGAIVVVISHQLSTIRQVADKVLALRNGVVERFGSKQAVLLALQPKKETAPPLRVLAGQPGSEPRDRS